MYYSAGFWDQHRFFASGFSPLSKNGSFGIYQMKVLILRTPDMRDLTIILLLTCINRPITRELLAKASTNVIYKEILGVLELAVI